MESNRDKEKMLLAEQVRKAAWLVAKRLETDDSVTKTDVAVHELRLILNAVIRYTKKYNGKYEPVKYIPGSKR